MGESVELRVQAPVAARPTQLGTEAEPSCEETP